jgi:uncharacterized protein (TIGR03000 family)
MLVATLAVLAWSAASASAQRWGWYGGRGYGDGYGYSGWGQYGYYGSYGRPYYRYGGMPYWGGYSSYYSPSYAYGSSDWSDCGDSSQRSTSFYSGPGDNENVTGVRLNVHVPPDARVFLDGQPTSQGGEFRQFVSPPLEPNEKYSYEIRASWTENGRPVERIRKVDVHNGQVVNLDFLTMGNRERDRNQEGLNPPAPERSGHAMPKTERTDENKPPY